MSIFEEQDFESAISEKGKKFLEGLKYLKNKYKKIGDVDGIGLALRIECTEEDGFTPDKKLCDAIIEEGLKGDLFYASSKYGIVLNNGGYYKNVITLVPPVTITEDEITMAIDLLDQLFARF
jgi:4-aminobutyrate aminotransferase-like enzyme